MEVEAVKSRLFQVPLTPTDVKIYEPPPNQPLINPTNCGAVTGQLLGLVSSSSAEQMTAQQQGVFIDEWVTHLNVTAGGNVYRSEETTVDEIHNQLFEGNATMVLFLRPAGMGHYVVLANHKHKTYLLDPQVGETVPYEGIRNYLQTTGLTGEILVVKSMEPRTKEQHEDVFIDDLLSWQMSACKLGGKRKTQRRKHRKSRLRRKRNSKTRK